MSKYSSEFKLEVVKYYLENNVGYQTAADHFGVAYFLVIRWIRKYKENGYTGLNKYFTNIVISSEVGYSKPEKEIFDIACRMVNLEPKNCVMIGDKYKVDIEGAINAGMHGIWVNRKNEHSNYEYQIEELNEITKYL